MATDFILVVLLGLGRSLLLLSLVLTVRLLRVALPVSVLPRTTLSALPLLVEGRMKMKVRRERRINRQQIPPVGGCYLIVLALLIVESFSSHCFVISLTALIDGFIVTHGLWGLK